MYIERWFRFVVGRARLVLAVSVGLILCMAAFLPSLQKDTSPEAYIESNNPALIYRDAVKEIFGLDDPFVVAIEAPQGETIYSPDGLRLAMEITDIMMGLENIDRRRVVSLTTEAIAEGTIEELRIAPAFDGAPTDAAEIEDIRRRIENYPLFLGKLVARDGSMTVVVGEMIDQSRSRETFKALSVSLDELGQGYLGTLHLSGEGASAGYLDDYIAQDARRQLPFVAIFIMIVLGISFRSVSGIALPFAVAAGAAICAMGLRAMMGIPYFAISTGLIVVIVAISVADGIHILTEYREKLKSGDYKSTDEAIVSAMISIYRPVTLTTFTTVAGFVGIWLGTDMPPMKAFGGFAAVGVFVAWLCSVSVLPASLSIIHKGKTPKTIWTDKLSDKDVAGRLLKVMSKGVVDHAGLVMFFGGAILVGSIWAATLVQTDYSRIENFADNEPIRIADTAINRSLDGTYRLLVVVDALEPQGLTQPEVLRRIEALQSYPLSLPTVNGASSFVDILKEVNKGTAGGDPAFHVIPDDPDSVAQLFFVYESLGNPADLEDDIDFDRQRALVELRTTAGAFSEIRPLVLVLESYLVNEFNSEHATGSLSGRVYLNYHWLKGIEENHLISVAVAVIASLIMAAFTFRSFTAGLYCLYHVVFAVFMVYAIMGIFAIPLSITTAMFAAITIGLGIDFSIHSVERVQIHATAEGGVTAETIHKAFQSTGRALFYNLFALCLGFSALLASNNPTIIDFAILLIVAVAANFVASMTLLPAFILLTKPSFLTTPKINLSSGGGLAAKSAAGILIVAGSLAVLFAAEKVTAQEYNAEQVIENVANREDGVYLKRDLKMTLIDRSGKQRERFAKASRVDTDVEQRSLISFARPKNIRGTSFLSYDYHAVGAATDQWLYIPAMRRTRRVAGADRGKYFLGTDFTYDDIRREGELAAEDYDFTLATNEGPSEGTITLNGLPKSAEIAKELGYGRVVVDISLESWRPLRWEMYDLDGKHFKTLTFEGQLQVDGIWTQSIIRAVNHATNHQSIFEFSNISTSAVVAASDLDQRKLGRRN